MKEIKFRYYSRSTRSTKKEMFYNMIMTAFPMQIMQYIGLKDKNGTEIYEGDIIKYKTQFNKKKWYVDVIAQAELYDGIGLLRYDEYSNYNINMDSIQVIGNIHENPELLNGK